ncbi:MAG TPA: type II secretion system F family protein [Actinomycetota bacterium]|nr:type II secretion system F family protein [Actinomycetota bacterium]
MIAIAIGAPCLAFIAWFVRRARVGRRSRYVAGVRSGSARSLTPSFRIGAARAAVGSLAGMVFGGPVFASVGAATGAVSGPLFRSRIARNRNRRLTEQLPDMMRALAAAIRSGRSIPQALDAAREESIAPLRGALDLACARLSVGATLDEALDAFAAEAATEDAALIVETLKIGSAAGANLPLILDVAVESLVERERIARDRRATSAQAKMSAYVVGLMPIAFFAIVGSGARDQLRVLLGDPIGWALLAGGVILEAVGALWMRALLKPR